MDEEIQIDKNELVKQRNEKIKETGHYIEINIVIGKDNHQTTPCCDFHNIGVPEVASAILVLEHLTESIKEKYPEADFYRKLCLNSRMEEL